VFQSLRKILSTVMKHQHTHITGRIRSTTAARRSSMRSTLRVKVWSGAGAALKHRDHDQRRLQAVPVPDQICEAISRRMMVVR
jgi:hypothetical protein